MRVPGHGQQPREVATGPGLRGAAEGRLVHGGRLPRPRPVRVVNSLQLLLVLQVCFLLAQMRQLHRISRLRRRWVELVDQFEGIVDQAIIDQKRREMDL